jgi:hypothetical protein
MLRLNSLSLPRAGVCPHYACIDGAIPELFYCLKEVHMKKALTAPVQLWQLVVVAVLVAALTGTVVVSAAPLTDGLLPHGQVRMAVASGTDADAVNVPAGYSSVSVLEKTIIVPNGKVADLLVMGAVDIEGGAVSGFQYCFGQYRLDDISTGPQFAPGNYILEGFNPPPNNLTTPISGHLLDVAPGEHTIHMVVQAGYADCYALNRSMIILVNLH